MAGGKETPRQRLIGLMYIVFLALIALQVSSAIIEKFMFLNASLEAAVGNAKTLSDSKIAGIAKAVDEQPKYRNILEQANQVKKESRAIIDYIEKLKQDLITGTGGKDDEGKLNGAKETDKVQEDMIGGGDSKNGKAYDLKKKLDAYINTMTQLTGVKYTPLAMDAKDDPMFKNDREQKKKDFAHINFEETPLVAALAVMSDKQSRIANMESDVLGELAKKVGAASYKFDNIKAFYAAKSATVAAGTDYEADMFIMATASGISPTMKYRGAPVKVENGFGKVKFKAAAGNYDKEGNSKQTWEGTITIKKPGSSEDTTYKLVADYIVAKPVIQVQSGSVSALYLNCGNPLNIQVPALGSTYQPSFSASGAQIVNGGQKGEIIVVPNSKNKVKINVSSAGTAIGFQEFDVRQIPRPSLEVRQNGAPVDMRRGLNAPGPAALEIVPVPDPSFAGALPKEAMYRVASGEVVLARGKSPVNRFAITGNGINMTALRAQARPGDRIVLEVKTVQRKRNYGGGVDEIEIPGNVGVFTLSLN